MFQQKLYIFINSTNILWNFSLYYNIIVKKKRLFTIIICTHFNYYFSPSLQDFYKIIPQYETLFSELDNIHIPGDNNHYTCKSFERAYIQESFKPQLKKILNILERSKNHQDVYINEHNLVKHKPCVYYKQWFYHKIINHKSQEIDISKLHKI